MARKEIATINLNNRWLVQFLVSFESGLEKVALKNNCIKPLKSRHCPSLQDLDNYQHLRSEFGGFRLTRLFLADFFTALIFCSTFLSRKKWKDKYYRKCVCTIRQSGRPGSWLLRWMRLKLAVFITMLLLCFGIKLSAQEFYPVWEKGKIPGVNKIPVKDSIVDERIWEVETPGIYAFPATKAENTGTTVLICPGGGYQRASYVYNGFNFAKWFNTLGINVFVLIYRLPHQRNLTDRANAPVQDAQRAVKYIRANGAKWKINPDKLGVMGISAGGHLVSMLSTQPEDLTRINDALDTVKYRPDFAVLLSPVVSMGQWAHKGSRVKLLGADTSVASIEKHSAEKQVSAYTPPTFITHAQNDKTVNIRNSLMYYNALVDHNINASLHVFPQGGHGIRLTENPGSTELWLPLLHLWMKEMNFLTPIPFN